MDRDNSYLQYMLTVIYVMHTSPPICPSHTPEPQAVPSLSPHVSPLIDQDPQLPRGHDQTKVAVICILETGCLIIFFH